MRRGAPAAGGSGGGRTGLLARTSVLVQSRRIVGPRELRAGARSRLYSAREEWTQARSASDGASRPSRAPGLCWLRDSEERGKMDAYRTRDRRRGANVIA